MACQYLKNHICCFYYIIELIYESKVGLKLKLDQWKFLEAKGWNFVKPVPSSSSSSLVRLYMELRMQRELVLRILNKGFLFFLFNVDFY